MVRAAEVISELPPLSDGLVLAKSSSLPFSFTSLVYLLRGIGIRTLVVTDQCIDHTARDAVDRGYWAVCLPDACQAENPELRTAALTCFQGYRERVSVAAFEAAMVVSKGSES